MSVVIIFMWCLLSRFGMVNELVVSLNMIRLFDRMFGMICGSIMWCNVVKCDVDNDSVVFFIYGLSFCSDVYIGIIMNGSIMCISVIIMVVLLYSSLIGLMLIVLNVVLIKFLGLSSMF